MIIKLLKSKGLSPSDAAKALGVSTPQIYKWNRDGISSTSKHYNELQKLIPEIIPNEPTKTKSGLPDRRVNSGRKKQTTSNFNHTTIGLTQHEVERDSIFPKIKWKKK